MTDKREIDETENSASILEDATEALLIETKQFVDPIEEVQFNVTSNGVKIANSDESFFGETL